jgi:hypothetical protein
MPAVIMRPVEVHAVTRRGLSQRSLDGLEIICYKKANSLITSAPCLAGVRLSSSRLSIDDAFEHDATSLKHITMEGSGKR